MILHNHVVLYHCSGLFLVVQNRITAYWFKNKELALAFGITLAFSRFGSVLNFFLTKNFESVFGLKWTLWAGNSFRLWPLKNKALFNIIKHTNSQM